MRLLLQTNNLVLLSYARSVLEDAGIEAVVLDENISAVEGSIGVFPRRLMVGDDDVGAARTAMFEAGLQHELASPYGD